MAGTLTVVIPNKNRLDISGPAGMLTLKSLAWQTHKDFDVIIVDGGSDNYNDLKNGLKSFENVSLYQNKILGAFNKPLLNNLGIRISKTEYVLCTDIDIMFAPNFIQNVVAALDENTIVESRTLFWKEHTANKVYGGEIDPLLDLDACRVGRIKYWSTCGGCQCMHKSKWNLLRGYDETFIGWGSEDRDLLDRAQNLGLKVKWLNDERSSIMLFHQPHSKPMDVLQKDLAFQEENKKKLFKKRIVNESGWGGIISP